MVISLIFLVKFENEYHLMIILSCHIFSRRNFLCKNSIFASSLIKIKNFIWANRFNKKREKTSGWLLSAIWNLTRRENYVLLIIIYTHDNYNNLHY